MKVAPNENRVPLNRLVKPATVKLVKRLAKDLDMSEGKVLDRAVEALTRARQGVKKVLTAPRVYV